MGIVPKTGDRKHKSYRTFFCVGTCLITFLVSCFILWIVFMALYLTEHNKHNKECPNNSSSNSSIMPPWPKPSFTLLGTYTRASVSADNVYCSEVGRNVLIEGGNAVDAAVATLFCIGVFDAQSTGLGGGHYMTIYDQKTKQCTVLDSREVAPQAATENMYANSPDDSKFGWRAVAVPGQLHGLWTAFVGYGSGKIKWSRLLEPAIQYIRNGYPCSQQMDEALQEHRSDIFKSPTMKEWINPDTRDVFREGEIIKTREILADFMEKLANSPDPLKLFYDSDEVTQKFVDEFKANGGLLTRDDFRGYQTLVKTGTDVLITKLKNDRYICGPPPSSSSAVTHGIIHVMDGYDNNLNTFDGVVDFFHRFIESSKFAFATRSWLADPVFVPNATEIARNMTRPEWAEWVRSKITDQTHDDSYYGGDFEAAPEDHGTTHISVTDADGNMVSTTSTINLYFGAIVSSESTGIVWNDEMDDFSSPGHSNAFGFPPSPANFIRPGKRPLSSMSPLIIYSTQPNGKSMVVGGAGGSTIITGTAAVALHTMMMDQDVKTAMDFPRIHNQLRPNDTYFEPRWPPEYLKALAARGHKMTKDDYLTEMTCLARDIDGKVYANTDFRKGFESSPAGY